MKPYYDKDGITIYCGDCREVVPSLPGVCGGGKESLIDLVLTDPPFGIQMAKKGAHSSIRDNGKWPVSKWDDERSPDLVRLAVSVARNAMIWGGNFYTDVLPPSASWLAWIKPEAESGFSLADMELCWSNGGFAARVKKYARRDGGQHPTQKPVSIMTWSLSFFPSANRILDPFMGSGTTLRAAKDLGRKAIGIEIHEPYCEIAAKRLEQNVLQFEPPAQPQDDSSDMFSSLEAENVP